MPVNLVVPSAGESITEVTIGIWLKKPGDFVQKDEPIVEIDTDKVSLELSAPMAGVLKEALKATGDPATVGEVIGYLEPGEGGGADTSAAKPATAVADAPKPAAAPAASNSGHVMPAAARAAHDAGVDASTVTGSGPGGRVLKEDISKAPAAPGPTATKAPTPAAKPAAPTVSGGARSEEVVRMTPLRRTIATRLVEAQNNAALLTTFNDVDMSAVMAFRKKYKDAFSKKYDINLGFMSFFVKAAVTALKEVPSVNAEIRGTDLIYKNYCDIGVAIGGGKGLVVPVIRNAERMSFAQVEGAISDFAMRAKANKLDISELQGGTFTISNGGVYGSLMSTPIVNPPQSGILGMHRIEDRPVVVDGQIVIRPMMYLALSYDHRVIDGRESVTFLKRIKECIEEPERMLVEI